MVETEALAWRMASSLVVGGVREEREDCMARGKIIVVWIGFEGNRERDGKGDDAFE